MKLKLALTTFLFSSSLACADAEFPDSNSVSPDQLPEPVLVQIKQTCKKQEGFSDPKKWNVHKFTMDKTTLYFVWCVPGGSNDLRLAVVEQEGKKPFTAYFGKDNVFVANPRWNEKNELVDTAEMRANCTMQKIWIWQQDKFKLSSEEKLGCD